MASLVIDDFMDNMSAVVVPTADTDNDQVTSETNRGGVTLTLSSTPEDWAMLAAHNLSMADLLASFGLDAASRWFDPGTELALVLAFAVVTVLGLTANLLVAATLCRRGGHLRSPRHCYLFNLVVSDVLTCVLCVPFTVLRLTLKDWRLGEVLCRLVPFLQLTYVFVSIFTILAIALERYRAIVCCSQRLSGSRGGQVGVRVVLSAVWLLALGLATPLAVNQRLEHVHNETGQVVLTLCVEHWQDNSLLLVYTVVLLLCQYALPAAAIMTLHLLICRFLRARVHLRVALNSKPRSEQKLVRHRKNLVVLTLVSVLFDVGWLPITLVNIMADVDPSVFPSARAFSLTYGLCLLFALTSVCVNPIVYGCFNSTFRRDLRAVCRGKAGNVGTSGSPRRGSSEVTSRLFTTALRSSVVSRHRGSLDAALTLSVVSRPTRGARKHHSLDHTLDSAAGSTTASLWPGDDRHRRRASEHRDGPGHVPTTSPSRHRNILKGQRRSLQLEL